MKPIEGMIEEMLMREAERLEHERIGRPPTGTAVYERREKLAQELAEKVMDLLKPPKKQPQVRAKKAPKQEAKTE